MDTQVIGIILLAIIIASNFIDFKGLLNSENKKEESAPVKPSVKPIIETIVPDASVEQGCNNSVFCAVKKWEELKRYCEISGLKSASSKLDEIFPLLAVKEEKNV